jgi:cellulase
MVHVFFRLAALAVACVNAHTIFQKVSVNGVDQGALVGVRSPAVNTVSTALLA